MKDNSKDHDKKKIMKKILKYFLVVLIALALGIGSAFFSINIVPRKSSIKNGAWITNPLTGSKEANMYLRAAVSLIGLFALNKTETIYYTTFKDDDGNPLRADCDYIIEGGDMDARWWSITAYGEDHFLIPNDGDRYSYNMKNTERDKNGRYKIHLSTTPKKGNWLPLGDGGKFSLSLRIYNPAPNVYENMGTIQLPRIIKGVCK